MIVKDVPVVFTWNLLKTITVYAEDYFDLIITDPDGIVSYTEGSALWADTFQAPTETVAGFLTNSLTFTKAGLYTVVVGTGGAAGYTVLSRQQVVVAAADTTNSVSVNLA